MHSYKASAVGNQLCAVKPRICIVDKIAQRNTEESCDVVRHINASTSSPLSCHFTGVLQFFYGDEGTKAMETPQESWKQLSCTFAVYIIQSRRVVLCLLDLIFQ